MDRQNRPPPDHVICPCSGTTHGQIERLEAQGLDLDAISRKTGALTGCGGCEWDIADLLVALAAQRGSGTFD